LFITHILFYGLYRHKTANLFTFVSFLVHKAWTRGN